MKTLPEPFLESISATQPHRYELISKLSCEAQSRLFELGFPYWIDPEFQLAQIIETHISIILLGESLVYKVKKPIELPFVDHRKLSERYSSCQSEVLLNRRLTTDVYLGVCFLSHSARGVCQSSLHAQPERVVLPKEAIESVVVMKKLADTDCLQVQLFSKPNADYSRKIDQLGQRLAAFHRIPADNPPTVVEEFWQAVQDNISFFDSTRRSTLSPAATKALSLISSYVEEEKELYTQLAARHSKGLFVEGHGDLRTEHIYFSPKNLNVIDCVEFSRKLRTVDVLNDVSFLAMDLTFCGRADLADQLLASYGQHTSGAVGQNLARFYCCYRAMVRAKVEFISVEQQAYEHSAQTLDLVKVERYLGLASRYSLGIRGPLLVLVGGYMGVGKSTLARSLQSLLCAEYYSSDDLRSENLTETSSKRKEQFAKGVYSITARDTIYSQMTKIARQGLNRKGIVILDATFSKREFREKAYELALEVGAPCIHFQCTAPRELIAERLRSRARQGKSNSDGRLELLDAHIASFEPFDDQDQVHVAKIDVAAALEEQLAAALAYLERQKLLKNDNLTEYRIDETRSTKGD